MLNSGSLPQIKGEDLFLEINLDLMGCILQIRLNAIFYASYSSLFCGNRLPSPSKFATDLNNDTL